MICFKTIRWSNRWFIQG